MYRGNDSLAKMFNQKASEQTHNLRGDFTPTPVDVNIQTVSLEAPVSGGFNLQPVDTTVSSPANPTGMPELQYKPLESTEVLQSSESTSLNSSPVSGGGMVLKPAMAPKTDVAPAPSATKPTNKYRNIVIAAIVLLAIYGIYKYSSKK